MPARKKKTRKAAKPREALRETLDRLEGELPSNLARLVRQLRRNLIDLEKQLDRARTERERRWGQLERQVRRDLAGLLRRMEKAVEPKPRRKKVRKKSARKPTGSPGASAAA